jgi:hypothetical protein
MSSFNIRDIRNLNRRIEQVLDRLAPAESDGIYELVAITITNGFAYPTVTGVYYWLQPQVIGGNEIAGTTATLTGSGKPLIALSLGPNPPAQGKPFLISASTDGHWVFQS